MGGAPPPKRRRYTDLAEKYDHPNGPGHEIISTQYPFKSGLTPLINAPFTTAEERTRFINLEIYQRKQFQGFSTAELHAVEAFAPLINDQVNFLDESVPLHPLYARSQWQKPVRKHMARYPIGAGRPGYFDVDNPIIWDAILPALRMASLFLSNAHFWPWWDALVAGEYDDVKPENIPDTFASKEGFGNFKVRPPFTTCDPAERKKLQDLFLVIVSRINIQFMSMRAFPESGLRCPNLTYGTVYGRSSFNLYTELFVGFELVESLLQKDLTTAERAIDLFRLAITLLHETAHAVWSSFVTDKYPMLQDREPYFEGEVLSELGYSLESTILGGHETEIIKGRTDPYGRYTSSAAILQGTWPSTTHANYTPRMPILEPQPPEFSSTDRWVIPVDMFFDFSDTEFWNCHIQRFGDKATKLGPKKLGNRLELPPGAQPPNAERHRQAIFNDLTVADFAELPIDPNMHSADTVTAINLENFRRRAARRIDRQFDQQFNRRNTNLNNRIRPQAPGALPPHPPSPIPASPVVAPIVSLRHDEIRDYLFANERELGLETLDFEMPEHVLFNYVQRHGGINLTSTEFRDFVIVSYNNNRLFDIEIDGPSFGIINKIPEGWPPRVIPKRPTPIWGTPNRFIMAAFYKCAAEVVDCMRCFVNGFMDHDIDEFRRACNLIYSECPEWMCRTRLGAPVIRFGELLFEAILWRCDRDNGGYTFGPAGIIRRTRKVEDTQGMKRKRDVIDRCNNM